jgi:FkbM family methyltransferase
VSVLRKLLKVGTLWSWVRSYRNWPVALKVAMFGSSEMNTITTRDGVKVLVRPDTNDFGIFNSVYAGHTYSPPGFEIQPDFTILDIGANIGSFSLCAGQILRKGRGRVFAFEPFPENYEQLRRNIEINSLQGKVTPIERAVWGSAGTLQVHVNRDREEDGLQSVSNTGKHSCLPELANSGAKTVDVQTTTLDQIVKDNNLATIDLLKLDCEGAEYEILFKASRATIERIKRITMEVHPLPSQGRKEIEHFLREYGFFISGEGEYLYAMHRTASAN